MDGLVPINYRGATYNIPVHIWVEPDYPSRPVRPYVVPVQGMMIVPGHQHVGADGCCYFPYLNAWNPQTSNIAALVAEIQAAFSAHPPVVSGTEAPAPAPAPVPVPAPAPAPAYQPPPQPQPVGDGKRLKNLRATKAMMIEMGEEAGAAQVEQDIQAELARLRASAPAGKEGMEQGEPSTENHREVEALVGIACCTVAR